MQARAAPRATPSGPPLFGVGDELQRAGKLVVDIGVPNAGRTGPSDDEDVAGASKLQTAAAEELAHHAANAVALWRAAHLAAGSDTEARRLLMSLADDHNEVRDAVAPSLALQGQELVSLAQPES